MKRLNDKEAMNINGGFGLGLLIAGAIGTIGYGFYKAYNSSSAETLNDTVCDVFGKPLPFKSCK